MLKVSVCPLPLCTCCCEILPDPVALTQPHYQDTWLPCSPWCIGQPHHSPMKRSRKACCSQRHKTPEGSRCLLPIFVSISSGRVSACRAWGRYRQDSGYVQVYETSTADSQFVLEWDQSNPLLILCVLCGHETQGQVFGRSNSSEHPVKHSRLGVCLLLRVLFLQQPDCWRVSTEEFWVCNNYLCE